MSVDQGQVVTKPAYALRVTGDVAVACGAIDTLRLADGVSVEAWVRPSVTHRGIEVFSETNFQGSGVAFKAGRYDDLTRFRIASLEADDADALRHSILSICVPPGYRAVLFDETGCQGEVMSIDNDMPHLGSEWQHRARSLLVIDELHRAQEHIVVYSESGFCGHAQAMKVRRFEDLGALSIGSDTISSLSIPPGLEVTLYAKPGCLGASVHLQGEVANLEGCEFDARAKSLAVTRALAVTADGVTVYDKENFQGTATVYQSAFFHESRVFEFVRSVRIPPGLQMTWISAKGGAARTFVGGQSAFPQQWFTGDDLGYLMIAHAPGKGGPGIWVEGADRVWELAPGRYDTMQQFGHLGGAWLRRGHEIILFEQEGCTGPSQTFSDDETLIDLSPFADKTRSLMVVMRARVLVAPSDFGLHLEVMPGALSTSARELQFAGARLRTEHWSHLALLHDANSTRFYLNGREVAQRKSGGGEQDLSGEWTLGQGFRGDLRNLRIRSERPEPRELAKQRFASSKRDDPHLVAAWPLDAEDGPVRELVSGQSRELPATEAFWVATRAPGSPAESAIGQKALIEATRRKNAAVMEKRRAGHSVIAAAQKRADAHLEVAHARASARSFEAIHFIRGGSVGRVSNDPLADATRRKVQFVAGSHADEVSALAFSADSRLALSGSRDGTVILWDAHTGVELVRRDLDSWVTSIFAWRGNWLVGTLSSGIFVLVRRDLGNIRTYDASGLLAVSANGKVCAALVDGRSRRSRIQVWNADRDAGTGIDTWLETGREQYSIALDLAGDRVTVGGLGGSEVQVWNIPHRQKIDSLYHQVEWGRQFCVALDNSGDLLLSAAAFRHNELRIWDLKSSESTELVGHTEATRRAVFHPDGRHAVSCADDHTIRIWDLNSKQCIDVFEGHNAPVMAVAIAPDGRSLISGGKDGDVWFWPLPSLVAEPAWEAGYFTDLALDVQSKTLFAARGYPHGAVLRAGALLYDRARTPVLAIAVDATHSDAAQRLVYWIEGTGALLVAAANGQSPVTTLQQQLVPGRDGKWDLALDQQANTLYWSNGREIWCAAVDDGRTLGEPSVIVSNGQSPYPVALTVDYENSKLYWLDKEQHMLRTAAVDGRAVRDLYAAHNPKAALAIDVGTRRLFWSAEHSAMIESAIIDDAGLFCWLQDLGDGAPNEQRIAALQDTRRVGVKWTDGAGSTARRALAFSGGGDHIVLDALYLDCTRGLTAEFWIDNGPHTPATLLDIGDEVHGDLLALRIEPNDEFSLTVQRRGGDARTLIGSRGSAPLHRRTDSDANQQWLQVVATIDENGIGTLYLDGVEIAKDRLVSPRTGLMPQAFVGRDRTQPGSGFAGKMATIRLWNRVMAEEEVAKLRAQMVVFVDGGQFTAPPGPFPHYHRSLLEHRDHRPQLLTGMLDGSVPAVALFPLEVDGGICLQSKSAALHAELLTAHHDKEFAIRKAAADKARKRAQAHARLEEAHAQHDSDHHQADLMVTKANDDARNQRRDAHDRLQTMQIRAAAHKERARSDAKQQQRDAESQAQEITGEAWRKADGLKRSANQELARAQQTLSKNKEELDRKS